MSREGKALRQPPLPVEEWQAEWDEQQRPWLLFDPDGALDGVRYSPRTLDEAWRKIAPRQRKRLEADGWTMRPGTRDEVRRLLQETPQRGALTTSDVDPCNDEVRRRTTPPDERTR